MMIPLLRNALDTIDAKQREEPDFDARDWSFVDEEEAEMYGDVFLFPDDD